MTDTKNSLYVISYHSPIGTIEICGTNEYITTVHFKDNQVASSNNVPEILKRCARQLDEYFNHQRQDFDLPLKLKGSDFQLLVWKELQRIPFGVTQSYSEIARLINKPRAVRAVGGANHANPIAIIIPCHRVIGADGRLVGYGGGLWRKKWLLEHEGLMQT